MTRRSKRKSASAKSAKKSSAEEVDETLAEEVGEPENQPDAPEDEDNSATEKDSQESEADNEDNVKAEEETASTEPEVAALKEPEETAYSEPEETALNEPEEMPSKDPEGTASSAPEEAVARDDIASGEPQEEPVAKSSPTAEDPKKISDSEKLDASQSKVISAGKEEQAPDTEAEGNAESVVSDLQKNQEKEVIEEHSKDTETEQNKSAVAENIDMEICEENKEKTEEATKVTETSSEKSSEEKKEENLGEAEKEKASEDIAEDSDEKPGDLDGYQVVDEIDLTRSEEEDEGMEVEEELPDPEKDYIIQDYDDPILVTLDIDPEQDGNAKIKESKDFLKYWRPVQDNPQEFTSWTYLLQFVEQDGKLPLARRAFNNFFDRYPLCYGYWKKFSELERKAGNLLRAQKILERGVRAIPLSIDLWVHVIDFYINHYNRPDAGVEKVRKIFERAVKAAGEEFRSEKLWNKYIKWEVANKNWLGVMAIYGKALSTQTQHYSILFSDFKAFVNKHSPAELVTNDEFNDYLLETRKALADQALKKAEEKAKEKKDADCEVVETKDEEEEMDEAPPGVEDYEKPPSEEELKAIRVEIIKNQKKMYDETEQLVTKIWAFEEGIKRPYFHVKQLERAQLKNWREYLDMEIGRENHHRIVLLFERCLIACALYEDFWLKYAKYMAKFDTQKTVDIFERACNIHLPKKPNIHIQWSAHEELQGNFEKACKIMERLDNALPGMAMVKMRRVAIERRAGNIQAAEDLLRSYVAAAVKDKEEIFYTRKLAWFLMKMSDKKAEAKQLLKDLIPKYKSELKLYNDLVEMEFQCAGKGCPAGEDEEVLAMEAFDIALTSDKVTDDQKFTFSQRKLEYLEDFGCDVKRLQKVYDEHQKLVRSHKKRTQIDLTVDETPAKKVKTDAASISVVGSSQLSNGARYSSSAAATATSYTSGSVAQATAYASGDPSAAYYQQQGYWNYAAKPADTTQPHYNYSQWSQYYGGQR